MAQVGAQLPKTEITEKANTLLLLILVAAALNARGATQADRAPEKSIAVTVDARKPQAPISPYLFGQFIEHIGDLVNRSVWAEMLDDRKFYFPI
ncbi:MAG: hypothetical protein JO217_03895, partial [Acidobacteriaceae bacterium]|nr:hypothetical protein [Acidobacteriaceae bacterium]